MVGIITCNNDDFLELQPAVDLFDKLQVPYELLAINPYTERGRVVEYAERARSRGVKFILAATGDAPDLPLLLAKHSILPVVGVPLRSTILGMEEPYSSVEMTEFVPVATVALGDSHGAALIALRSLSLGDDELRMSLDLMNILWPGNSSPSADDKS